MTVQLFGIQPKTPSASKNNVQFYWRYVAGATPQAQPFMQVDGSEYPFAVGVSGSNLSIQSGTFTPTLIGSSTAGTATFLVTSGNYMRIGQTVFVSIYIKTSDGHTGSGRMRITGLPFTILNDAPANVALVNAYSGSATCVSLTGFLPASQTYIDLYENRANAGAITMGDTTVAGFVAGQFLLSGTYETSL